MKNTVLFFTLLLIITFSCKKEETKTPIVLDDHNKADIMWHVAWNYSSTPLAFPESSKLNDLTYNINRSRVSWYFIDPIFQNLHSETPSNIDLNDMSNHLVRKITGAEILKDKDIVQVLNIAHYPKERGIYNYDVLPSEHSAGVNNSGDLQESSTRWSGIQQYIGYLEDTYHYLEFWMMDPYVEDQTSNGKLYINIGSISEEVLYDQVISDESMLSFSEETEALNDTNNLGIIGGYETIHHYFTHYEKQDAGLDGLHDEAEQLFYSDFLSQMMNTCNESAYNAALQDPSSDNYHYHKGTDYDNNDLSILERHKNYNKLESNSLNSETENYPTQRTLSPDCEDINKNGSLESNNYNEYQISIHPNDFVVKQNYIDSVNTSIVELVNGSVKQITWYHFKIPISQNSKSPLNTVSKDYIRIYLTDFENEMVLRFADMNLIKE